MTLTSKNNSIDPKALSWTIGVHALLLLLFFFWRYTLPAQPATIQEYGMEVNLGTSDDGLGSAQPQDPEDPSNAAAASHHTSGGTAALPDMEKSEDDDNPAVNTADKRSASAQINPDIKRGNQNPLQARQTTQRQQSGKYVYAGANGKGGNGAIALVPGGAEGNTHGNGDRGVPHGTPGAPNYTGTPGNGTGGIAFSLSGRKMVGFPDKSAEFREGGKVVIRVTVNKAGAVVNSNILSTSNSELSAIALRKVRSVRFNKSEDAPQEQFGTITFVFRAGQ